MKYRNTRSFFVVEEVSRIVAVRTRIAVKMSGINWLEVHETPVKRERNDIISSPIT